MKKILIFRNSKLGDYLISLPSIKLIKKKYKNCKIYYLSSKNVNYKNLPSKIENFKFIDKFLYFENNIIGYFKIFYKLKKINFDTIYNLQENSNFPRNLKNYLFFFFLGIKNKKGFFYKILNYENYSETYQIARRIKENLKNNQIFALSKIKKIKEKKLIKTKYITISIGGFSQPKLWKLKYWAELCRQFLSIYNYKIIVTGTKDDFKNGKILCKINNKKIFNYCGKLNLKKLFNIIKFSQLHITNDNGSMHISTLYNKKTICLFNNHDPKGKWYPANCNAKIFRSAQGINKIKPKTILNFISNFI